MKLPKIVEKELQQSKLPWEVVRGSSHRKIWLAGYFVGILPTARTAESRGDRADKNLVAQIRRVSRIVHEHAAQR